MELLLKERIRTLKAKLNSHYAIRPSHQVNERFVEYIERELETLRFQLKQILAIRVAS